MPLKNASEWIWFSGNWVPWHEATVHVSTHALHYGSSVFEGIRTYATDNGPAVFRLTDHMARFMYSAKIMRMGDQLEFSQAELETACVDLVARNKQKSCYIRPLAFRDSDSFGLNAAGQKVEVVIISIEWGRYLGADGIENGIDAAVTSWRRVASSPMAKVGGQYVNNQQVSMEAKRHGYTEGITLDVNGNLSEGAGENLFLMINGTIYTPSVASSILSGITRDTVLTLAADLGIPVREETLVREMLYIADEIFMTGTAAEITPIRSVDGLQVGSGKRGPITKALQDAFFATVEGRSPDVHGWLTYVQQPVAEAGDD
ncbi:MAG: branched-chain amino acid transaminase [Anaerolineae bacterium]|nr:branched-chain amino acid transaminase [Anaerolineae bacterium]